MFGNDADDDGGIELSRRTVLGGIAGVGVGAGAVSTGTYALMSDEEESANNTIQAGEMDLTLGANVSKTVNVSDLMPGEGGKETFKVNNVGDADGDLSAAVTNVRNAPGAPNTGAVHTFTSEVTGYFDNDTHDNVHDLSDFGVDDAVTTVELLSNGSTKITVDLPAELGAASSGDNLALLFDTDDDGTADFQVVANQNGVSYQPFTASGWDQPSRSGGNPNGYALSNSRASGVSASRTQGTIEVTLGSGRRSGAFAFGGQVVYNGLHDVNGMGPSDGINDRVLLTPGFSFGPGFDGDSSRYVTVDPGKERTLADVLDVEVRVDTDVDAPELDADDDGDLMVQGKPTRIEGAAGGSSALSQGGSKYVEVIYRLPYNAGNVVSNETCTFDLDLSLEQSV